MRSDCRDTRLLVLLLSATALLTGCERGDSQGGSSSTMRWGADLLGSGSNVTIADSVGGDVMIAGGRITFSGVAGGDFLGAGATQEIGGRVSGDVRAAGGEVRFSGQVAKNVAAAGREIEIGEDATIAGNAYIAGQQVRVGGTIGGFLRAAGQEIVLDGAVDGSVDVRGGSLRVGPGARITGDLTYAVPAENVVVDPAAQISGSVTERPVTPGPPVGVFKALWMIGFLVAGAAAVALFPGTATAAVAGLRRRPAAALGIGVVWLLLVPLCIVAVGVTVIGLPLALILLALYLISIYIARAVVALWLGQLLLGRAVAPGRGRLVTAFLLGGVILQLFRLVPWLGAIVTILATLFGLGALVVAYIGRREYAEEI